jgi:hypothetical protein
MTWLICFCNIASLIIAFKKKVIVYFVLSLYFFFLVVGQAFQIETDLAHNDSISYSYAFMTQSGFRQASWFLLASSLLSLMLVALVDGYRPGSFRASSRTFNPPRFFYLFLLLILLALAGTFVFVVIGLSTFLSSSRPGYEGGSTVFLTLLGVGVYPLLLKVIYNSRLVFGDLACAAIPVVVSLGCSRMHVILYVTTILTAFYYGKGWADLRITWRAVASLMVIGSVALFAFIAVGALRDAQNYTSGGIRELWEYNVNHPERNMFATDVMYQRSVEGMSGLTGAFTAAEAEPDKVSHEYGLSLIIEGLDQAMPGFVKERVSGLEDYARSKVWYTDSVVPSGIETAYTSFGWVGALVYPLVFFGYAWVFSLFVVKTPLSPPLRLCCFMLLGCSIFLIRGSVRACLGYSIAYVVTILASAPAWRLWLVSPTATAKNRLSNVWASAPIESA